MINNLQLIYRGCQKALSMICKAGIMEDNKRRAKIEGEPTFLRERNEGIADLVTCRICSGFYIRKKLQHHNGICAGNVEVTGNNLCQLQVKCYRLITPYHGATSKLTLNRFHEGEMGKLCRCYDIAAGEDQLL